MRLDIRRRTRPEYVRQELWTGLLAYHLVRQSLRQSALASGRRPHPLSFASALQMLANTWVLAAFLNDSPISPPVTVSARERLIALRILNGHCHRAGQRPNRVEPRAVKRRPSPLALLTELRAAARDRLKAGQTSKSQPRTPGPTAGLRQTHPWGESPLDHHRHPAFTATSNRGCLPVRTHHRPRASSKSIVTRPLPITTADVARTCPTT